MQKSRKVGGLWRRGLIDSKVGVVGDVGYGGCKPRIEGIVICT